MKKISNSKIYIVVTAIVFCIFIAFAIRYFLSTRNVQAFISSYEIYKGESISYSDSTFNAREWLWEFGNGETSNEKSGEYRYTDVGTYQVRLTVNDKKSLQKEFIVNVRNPIKLERDSLIRINAPDVAMQEEYIVFRGVGFSKEWRWSFGETGIIDSRDQVAIYSYSMPGTYEIALMTEDTKYPVTHKIEILPKYMEVDTTDVLALIGNDIKEKLQAIVDGKPFNPNYNHIMSKYLCDNPQLLVVVNNNKKNDFYSYCQGLKIIGKRNTTIVEVIVIPDESRPDCLQKLFVTQFAHDE